MSLADPAPRVPHRIQRRRTKGWRKPPDAVTVDRSTMWGNPFYVGRHNYPYQVRRADHWTGDDAILHWANLTAEQAVRLYRMWFMQDTWPDGFMNFQRDRVGELSGHDLVCWCKPGEACHADFLLSIANAPDPAAMLGARTRAIYDLGVRTASVDDMLSWVIHPFTWRRMIASYQWAKLFDPSGIPAALPGRIRPGMRLFGMEVVEGIDVNGYKVVRTG